MLSFILCDLGEPVVVYIRLTTTFLIAKDHGEVIHLEAVQHVYFFRGVGGYSQSWCPDVSCGLAFVGILAQSDLDLVASYAY